MDYFLIFHKNLAGFVLAPLIYFVLCFRLQFINLNTSQQFSTHPKDKLRKTLCIQVIFGQKHLSIL